MHIHALCGIMSYLLFVNTVLIRIQIKLELAAQINGNGTATYTFQKQ